MAGSCTRCGAVHPRHPAGVCPGDVPWKRREITPDEAARLTAAAIIKLMGA